MENSKTKMLHIIYQEDAISELLTRTGSFFAFSESQFLEKRVEGIKYSSLPGGMITPLEHAKSILPELDSIHKKAIEIDLENNSKNQIIIRELNNQEAFYTGDWMQITGLMEEYGFTEEEVKSCFYNHQS